MDILSNMLITIKNGSIAGKDTVLIPYSQFKADVARALLASGYIASYEKKSRKKGGDVLQVGLRYTATNTPCIHDVKRVSKPSRRLYGGMKDMYQVQHGRGHLFVSTPKGVLTGQSAQREQVGGELLFEIW